jgi:hypothetical protein
VWENHTLQRADPGIKPAGLHHYFERQLLNAICLCVDLPTNSNESIEEMRDKITEKLRRERSSGKRTVLIIDESIDLDFSSLGDGERLLRIFLVGQPELKEKLGRNVCGNYISHRINLAKEEDPSHYGKFTPPVEEFPGPSTTFVTRHSFWYSLTIP